MNVRSFLRCRWLAGSIVVSTLGACVTAEPPFLTIEGPETPAVRTGIDGHVAETPGRTPCALTSGIGAGSSAVCTSYGRDAGPAPPDLSDALIAAVLPAISAG